MTIRVHTARFADLDPSTLYALLRLRAEVFVVEQVCAFNDLDGRDVEADTWFAWACDGTEVVAGLRVLREPDGDARIGRVVTAPPYRGRGLAAQLMAAALALPAVADRPAVLAAQSHLAPWYAGFGFVPDGPEFLDDGIPHTPMRRHRF